MFLENKERAGLAGALFVHRQRKVLHPMYTVPFSYPVFSFEKAVSLACDTGVISGDAGPLLETVVEMLDELERPDAHFDCIQIAGTNGKTSTTRFTAAILRGEGLRCALYTSPQLVRYPERMEIDGAPISDELFARGISAAYEAGRRVNERRAAAGESAFAITPFDLLTVAALTVYALQEVDVAVLEVGMGGRWDATSATDPHVVAITGIGLDHMRILGNTLAEIASEKAAVIKPSRCVILGEGVHEPSVWQVMQDRCCECGVSPQVSSHEVLKSPAHLGDTLEFACETSRDRYECSLFKPLYQAQNATCAIFVAEEYLGRALDKGALAASLAGCPTPGRFDVLRNDPLVLIDACHNPQSCENFVSSLDEIDPDVSRRPVLLTAALADKDVSGIVDVLVPAFPQIVVTQTTSDRAIPAAELAQLVVAKLEELGRPVSNLVSVIPSVSDAVESLMDAQQAFVAAGTITLAGEVAGIMRG